MNKFKLFPFNEQNDIFGNPRPTMIPISMAIHERNDKDGTIWGSFSAMNFHEQRFYQVKKACFDIYAVEIFSREYSLLTLKEFAKLLECTIMGIGMLMLVARMTNISV